MKCAPELMLKASHQPPAVEGATGVCVPVVGGRGGPHLQFLLKGYYTLLLRRYSFVVESEPVLRKKKDSCVCVWALVGFDCVSLKNRVSNL